MNKHYLSSIYSTFIDINYTGGIENFYREGGNFLPDPIINNQVYLLHPSFPEILKEYIERAPTIITKFLKHGNFENLSEEKIKENLWNITQTIHKKYSIKDLLFYEKNPIALLVSVNKDLDEKIIEAIIYELLSSLSGLVRGFVFKEYRVYPFGDFGTESKYIPQNIIEEDISDNFLLSRRNTIISKDDILNVVISLNRNRDVLDIINEL